MLPQPEPIRRPLSELETHAAEWTAQLRDTHQPLVLTVDDKAEIVMQDAASYTQMLQRLEELETEQAIQVGLDDVAAGRTIPLDEAFRQIREKLDLRR